jgi:hypothetical protein
MRLGNRVVNLSESTNLVLIGRSGEACPARFLESQYAANSAKTACHPFSIFGFRQQADDLNSDSPTRSIDRTPCGYYTISSQTLPLPSVLDSFFPGFADEGVCREY